MADIIGNVWQMTDVFEDAHTRSVQLRGGSHYRPVGSNWYFPQAAPLDKHEKYMLMDDAYERAATIGFRCVQEAALSAQTKCTSNLCGVLKAPAGITDLTSEGGLDWVHFGSSARKGRDDEGVSFAKASFDSFGDWRLGALEMASAEHAPGSDVVSSPAFAHAPESDEVSSPTFAWSDGTGTGGTGRQRRADESESAQVGLSSTADGFVFIVSQTNVSSRSRGLRGQPPQPQMLKLKLYVGAHKGTGKLDATYKHGTSIATTYTDSSLDGSSAPSGTSTAAYELTFPASDGGELRVSWAPQHGQRAVLQAAALTTA
jgi:hypothetical protein